MESKAEKNQVGSRCVGMPTCLLCHSDQTQRIPSGTERAYSQCFNCGLIFMHQEDFPSSSEEEYRYSTHNNDIEDKRYQRFVAPIVNLVVEDFSPKITLGLDYGAGTGPVITKLLLDQGYRLELYDPFFHPNTTALKKVYDYVVCCEVVEHFHKPDAEFQRLFSLLKKGGRLYCMTDFLEEDQLFSDWYYKNDETHVAFYNPISLQWIKNFCGFFNVEKKGRLVVFSK